MMYEGLAGVYDRLSDFDDDERAKRYEALLKGKNSDLREICDAGCGTGALAIRLARLGYRVTGVDLSQDMLSRAQEKARREGLRIPFVQQDMCRLSLPHPVDGVLSACDGVNYLSAKDAAARFFAAAYACLRPGGALAFDVSSRQKLEQMGKTGLYALDDEDVSYIWLNRYDADRRLLTMDISFFVREGENSFRRFRETHVQRAYEPEELTALMRDAGFTAIDYREDEAESRIYFAARRPE